VSKERDIGLRFHGLQPCDPEPGKTNRKRCLWCGRPLRRARYGHGFRGDYNDDAFCALRCGYAFGVIAARLNFRFHLEDPPSANSPLERDTKEEDQ
jgi:hypothetical protein